MEGLRFGVPEKNIEEDTKSTLQQHTGGGRSDMASTSRCVATLAKFQVNFHFSLGCFQKTQTFLFRRTFIMPQSDTPRVPLSRIPGYG